jgi:hypothetical protein
LFIGKQQEYVIGGNGAHTMLWDRETCKSLNQTLLKKKDAELLFADPSDSCKFMAITSDESVNLWCLNYPDDVQPGPSTHVTTKAIETRLGKLEDDMRSQLAELREDMELMRAQFAHLMFKTDPLSTTNYADQGDMVVHVEEYDVSSGGIITLQHNQSKEFVYYTKPSQTIPVHHFAFKSCTPNDARDNPRCMFVVENDGDYVHLRNAFSGDLLGLSELEDVYEDGFMATSLSDKSVHTQLLIHLDKDSIRLVGRKGHHLVRTSHNVLATRSILPEPNGLFTRHNVSA